LLKRVNGQAGLGQKQPFRAQPGTFYTIRFQVVGSTLRANAWPTGQPEPGGWMLTASDTSFTSGIGGLRPNLAQDVTLSVKMFQETSPNP
jgi:hypothetical protein